MNLFQYKNHQKVTRCCSEGIALDIFLWNVAWSLLGNNTHDFYLYNVIPRVLRKHCTRFFHAQCFLEPLEQNCTVFQPWQCCPKGINQRAMKIIFSGPVLLGALRRALCRIFTCARFS